jgi:hypothetical protein
MIIEMDKQFYQDLIQYLITLTFMDSITNEWKILIQKNLTYYIY